MSEKPVSREEFEELRKIVDDLAEAGKTMLAIISLIPKPAHSINPPPPQTEPESPEPTQDFDSQVEDVCIAFAGVIIEQLTDEQKAKVIAALGHYVALTERNNDGEVVNPQQFTRAFREALNHAPESKKRNALRNICMFIDGGLPSPIKSRADVFGYVEPVVGDPEKEPRGRF